MPSMVAGLYGEKSQTVYFNTFLFDELNDMNELTKRKLRKLMRDPRQFFLDMKLLAPLLRPLLNRPLKPFIPKQRQEASNLTQSATTQHEEKTFLEFPDILSSLEHDEDVVKIMDKAGVNSLIFFWQVPEQLKKSLRDELAEFFIVYVNTQVSFVGASRAVKVFLEQHHLGSSRVLFSLFQDNSNAALATVSQLASVTDIPIRTFAGYGMLSTGENAISYVVDKKSFPFVLSSRSELLDLLNDKDLLDVPLMQEAPALLQLMRDLRVGAWPDYMSNVLRNFTSAADAPYVLIIGDDNLISDEDMACELAVARAAKEENSGLNVIYIPHPIMIRRLKTQEDFLVSLKQYCIPILNTVCVADAVVGARQVYTRKSLGAFFALVHAVPLTVFEDAFYAGWGLTDDRFPCENRLRTLTLEELFCGFFLLYQNYETISENVGTNFVIQLLKLAAFSYNSSIKSIFSDSYCKKNPTVVGQTVFWPLLLSTDILPVLLKENAKQLTTLFPIKRLLESCADADAQTALCFLFAGVLRKTPSWQSFISILSSVLPITQQIEIFKIWHTLCKSNILLQRLISAHERQGDFEVARKLLLEALNGETYDFDISGYTFFPPEKYTNALQLVAFEVRQRNLKAALDIVLSLLFSGCYTKDVLYYLLVIAKYRFHFETAELVARILFIAFPTWKSNLVLALYMEAAITQKNSAEALRMLAYGMERGIAAPNLTYLQKRLKATYGDYNWQYISGVLARNCSLLDRANNCLLSGQFEQARLCLYGVKPNKLEADVYFSTFIQLFILSSNFTEIDEFLNHMAGKVNDSLFYSESIKIALTRKNYAEAKRLYERTLVLNIKIALPIKYRIQYILGDFHGALETIYTMTESKTYIATMGTHYLSSLKDIDPNIVRSLIVLLESGPGDEIRGASHYRQIVERAGVERVVFTCDERLYKLFIRSFPELTFHPFSRFRHHSYLIDYYEFSRIPSSELVWMMDNGVWDAVQASDKVIRYFAARVDVVNSYDDIAGTPFLKADPEATIALRSQLKKKHNKPLVGLCWRSSLQSEVRNTAFFSPEELLPILELDCVQFVNCQSDGCTEKEKQFFEQYCPNKLLDVANIDQYNDFDSAAALYSALDLMISCPNTVMELAGALGVPTLTFTFTYEPDLHLKPGCKYNVYYNCVEHVGCDIPIGQRNDIIQELRAKIQLKFDH